MKKICRCPKFLVGFVTFAVGLCLVSAYLKLRRAERFDVSPKVAPRVQEPNAKNSFISDDAQLVARIVENPRQSALAGAKESEEEKSITDCFIEGDKLK